MERPGQYDGLLAARPRVVSTAWPTREQDLGGYVARAHAIGALSMHMVSTVADAKAAARAGVDVIVAQGTEGGGHVGVMGTMPLVPMVVSAVAPTPVLAAGGVADGRGLAAALALGADGVLLGTRFLASDEAPIAKGFKQAIVESDGHDTLVTDIPDVANGQVWPGAYVRVRRNRFIEEWIGRENELRLRRAEVSAQLREAAKAGDPDRGAIMIGQTAGLIDRVEPAADLVRQISRDAEAIPLGRLELRRDLLADYAEFLPPIPREQMRRIRGEQDIIVRYEPERALHTLSKLLADPADRERAVTLLARLLADPRVVKQKWSDATLGRVEEILGAIGADPAPVLRLATLGRERAV